MNSRAAERRSRIPLKQQPKEKNNMPLRTSVILVALTLFAVASTESAAMPWQPKPKQPKPKADAISGAWDAVLTTDDKPVQLTLMLKLEGNKVTGSSESSHLGSGAINNGSWVNNKLTITVETSHAPLTLTGALQNGKRAGEWDAGHMQGKWEAKKK
jgi:hypothetical protein